MSEKTLHTAVTKYLKLQYPKVVFMSEASGLRASIGVARQLKAQRSRHRLPDLVILEPRGGFHGLIIELKVDTPYKRDGSVKKGRLQEQYKTLKALEDKGYRTAFGVGFDHTKTIIDSYMNLKTLEK